MTLRPLVGLVAPLLSRAADRMWAAEPARDRYQEWLLVCHDLVRATAPLLTEALSACVRLGDGDLAAYYAQQLTDEFGHDRWVEQDWAAAGFDPARLASRIPAPATARLVGAQYYWVRHAHPIALVGHIAVLEWLPPRPDLVPELMGRTGLSAAAFRTLARHTALDTGHGQRLDVLLAGLALDPWHRQLMTTSAMTTAHGLVELMIELGARHESVTAGPAGACPAAGDH